MLYFSLFHLGAHNGDALLSNSNLETFSWALFSRGVSLCFFLFFFINYIFLLSRLIWISIIPIMFSNI